MNVTDQQMLKLQRERDLYFRLLQLGRQSDVAPLLEEALALIVELADTRQGYIELRADDSTETVPPWWMAHGFSESELEVVRAHISRGIIAEALASGRAVETNSALRDPRFERQKSVQREQIEAVLCAPIGNDPPRGVLYLQGRARPGPFSAKERLQAEVFAQHLAPLADRLLAQRRRGLGDDPTQPLRRTMRLEGVIGRSTALAALLKQVASVSPLDVSVLLTGESGTGKNHVARLIHDNGRRAGHPFVEVNCGALPELLVESELFGALPGAHSTATRRIQGKVAAAERGTLFLDEIGDLSPPAQAKLLQLLQSKQYYPLGGASPVQADVRVIAATNVDLRQAMVERRFREDLYYRLQVVPVRVPALAERREDIAHLLRFFCDDASDRHGLPRLTVSYDAVGAAEFAEWPGHVRQLAHAAEAAVIRCASEGALQLERTHLFPEALPPETNHPTFQYATRQFQTRLLRDTLEDTGWNVNETARRLDLARSHVYHLIRLFGVERAGG